MDTYQGSIGTISPAMGNYDIQIFLNIDKDPGSTGHSGVTGTGTLNLVGWEQGVTGMNPADFKNLSRGI